VQQPVLQLRDRLQALRVQPPVEPALQRRLRVLAEVEAVAAVDRLEEELDLERLQLGRRPPLGGTVVCGYW
jgi:hypothetical protein